MQVRIALFPKRKCNNLSACINCWLFPSGWTGLVRRAVETRCEKTSLRGFRPGPTQTGLYSHRRQTVCTIYVAKRKALISFAVTAKLICVFVLAYAKSWFSHDAAQLVVCLGLHSGVCRFDSWIWHILVLVFRYW